MPRLNTAAFEAGNLALRPTEVGVDATAQAARRVGAFYSQGANAEETLARSFEHLGQETSAVGAEQGAALASAGRAIGSGIEAGGKAAVDYMDHQQISHGATAFAGLMQGVTDQWNAAVKDADPNDPTVAKKFLAETLQPQLDQFKAGFSTQNSQRWAEAHADAFLQHMGQKTSADMASLAGQAAVVNQQRTVNSLSNTVRSDPSSLDFSLATLQSTAEGAIRSSPNLTGVEAARVRGEIMQKGSESIVKSAAFGYIEKTGNVPDWASDPKYSPYINGVELKQLAQAAKAFQSNQRSEQRWEQAQAKEQQRQDFNAQVNKLEADTFPEKTGEAPRLPQDYWQRLNALISHPGAAFEPGRIAAMAAKGEAITAKLGKPEPLSQVSHATTIELLDGIRSGAIKDTGAIYDKYGANALNNGDFSFVMREFANMRTPDGEALGQRKQQFLKGIEPQIDKSGFIGVPDEEGKERFYRFQYELDRKIGEYRKAGKDPHDLLDPSKPDYMGKPDVIEGYVGPFQRQIRESIAKNGGVGGKPPAPPAATALPPAPERKPNQVYPTPRGPMKWTGTGWVAP